MTHSDVPEDIIVREAVLEDRAGIVAVAEDLGHPDGWFTPEGIRDIGREFTYQRGVVAVAGGTIVGFAVYTVAEAKGRLTWLGLRRDRHRAGIGRRLVDHVVCRMAADGITELYVDTLGDSDPYEPYARTRAFYRALGFKNDHVVTQPDNPACPELLTLVLRIGESRS